MRKVKHFIDAKGKKAKISTDKPVENRSSFIGCIVEADDDFIEIALDEGKPGCEPHFKIPFELIKTANLVADYD